MNPFISSDFIKSLKEGYEAIPYIQGNDAAKIMVADSIKSNGYDAKDALSFISKEMKLSNTLNDKEWKSIIDFAIKIGYPISKNLEVYKTTLKGKLSNEEMFNLAAACYNQDADALRTELIINQYGWKKAVETLVKAGCGAPAEKTAKAVVKKQNKAEEKKTAVKKVAHKSPIKTAAKKDTRCIAIVGVKDGVRKEWESYRACEIEVGAGHGTVSQYFSGTKGLKFVKGWTLYKKGEEPKVKAHKSTKCSKKTKTRKPAGGHFKGKAVMQCFPNGKQKRWESLTAASKGTGICYTSISRAVSGTYPRAGGYVWKSGDSAA